MNSPPSDPPTPSTPIRSQSLVARLFDSETGRALLFLAFATVLGILGLQRLATYDEVIDKVRETVENRSIAERDFALKQYATMTANLESQFKGFSQGLESVAREMMERVIAEKQSALDARQEDFERRTSGVIDRIEQDLAPFSWLEEYRHRAATFTGITTISVARQRVEEMFAEGMDDNGLAIVEYAAKKGLPGSSSEYFNFSTFLSQSRQHPLSADIIDLGLKHYPTSVDLIAQGIEANKSAGRRERADELLASLVGIPKDKWPWRAFVFAGSFLTETGRETEGLETYRAFRQHIPGDERGYSLPGDYFLQLGRYDEALEILKQGAARIPRSAQTNLALAQAYIATGDYAKAINAASRSIEANSESQPTVSQAGVLWARASALDSLIHRQFGDRLGLHVNGLETEQLLSLVMRCVGDYRLAMSFRDAGEFAVRRGRERIQILRSLVTQLGVDPVIVEERFDEMDMSDMRQLLEFLEEHGTIEAEK